MAELDPNDFEPTTITSVTREEADRANDLADLLEMDAAAREEVLDRAEVMVPGLPDIPRITRRPGVLLEPPSRGGVKPQIYGAPKGIEPLEVDDSLLRDTWVASLKRMLLGYQKEGDPVALEKPVYLPIFQLDADDWVDTDLISDAVYSANASQLTSVKFDLAAKQAGVGGKAGAGVDLSQAIAVGGSFTNVKGPYQVAFPARVEVQKYWNGFIGNALMIPKITWMAPAPYQAIKKDPRFSPVTPKFWRTAPVGSKGTTLDWPLKITKGSSFSASVSMTAPGGSSFSLSYTAEYESSFEMSLKSKRSGSYLMDYGDGGLLNLRVRRDQPVG